MKKIEKKTLKRLLTPLQESKGRSHWWFSFVLFALFASAPAFGQSPSGETWVVTVKGKVSSPQEGEIIIRERKAGDAWQETITLASDNTFSKKIKLSEPGNYVLIFYKKQTVPIVLYKNDIEVNVDGSNPRGFMEVKGSPEYDLTKQIEDMMKATGDKPEIQQLRQEYVAAKEKQDEKLIEEIRQRGEKLVDSENSKLAAFLEEKSPSMAVVNFLQRAPGNFNEDKFVATYLAVAEKMKKEWSSYSITREFADFADRLKKLAVGQPAPEIALPDPEGKVVALSSMKGKYVLVDFWAKWCGPCRQENPNVVKAYNAYKDKGFTVFGVSLDRNKEDWVKAIAEDGLTWTHVSDLKYWQSEAAKTYNINSIPFSILVDPNGIIIDKNLRGARLENRLGGIFEKK